MKKLFTIILLVLAISFSYSQESKAYLGVGVGYATAGGDVADTAFGTGLESGISLNFVNFGYRFSKGFGITANLSSSGHPIKEDDDDAVGVGSISAGPMISVGISDKISWDFKPQYAFRMTGVVRGEGASLLGFDELTWHGNGFVIGNSIVMSQGKGFGWSIDIDYLSGKFTEMEADGETYDVEDDNSFSSLKIGVGVRYNF